MRQQEKPALPPESGAGGHEGHGSHSRMFLRIHNYMILPGMPGVEHLHGSSPGGLRELSRSNELVRLHNRLESVSAGV